MNNYERLKSLENIYEMTDIIMYFISTHLNEIRKDDDSITSIPLLYWLQEKYEE